MIKISPLGRSDLIVSNYCLGTMTWGSQNSSLEAFEQMDYALDQGINMVDTAEMYPTTPLLPETCGDTECIIGQWLARTGRRSDVVLATKITGEGSRMVRPDGPPIGPETLRSALEGSLERLQTDYIDLYQLHWPNRGSYHFRKSWTWDPSEQGRDEAGDMRAILEALGDFIAEGKLRHIGLSNETAWGTAKFLHLSETLGLPRVISIQNEYSLLHRLFDLDLAELSHQEDVGLLAFSPLSAGLLSAKYENGALPPGSRKTLNDTLNGRLNPFSEVSITAYAGLARDHGLDPAQMALAFCASRPFMGSVIIGATSMDQLRSDIASADLTLSREVLDGIAKIRRANPQPM